MTTPTKPMSHRDVWLTVALAVAKAQISAPYTLCVRDDIHMVAIDYREDSGHQRADAIRAAEHYGLPWDRAGVTDQGIHHASWYGQRDGWHWHVHAQLDSPLDSTPAMGSSPLADQVVAAIEPALTA